MPDLKNDIAAMELLAPAGSYSAFAAALDEGADAIYIGAPGFNARALARDFSYPEIHALIREAHARDVRVYIAMNSLLKENELGKAAEGLATMAAIQPDALIIQDFALYRLARRFFPELPLHASTLMAVHNSPGVNKLAEFGFRRAVLPRELTLEEIGSIHRKTGIELEVFVHGAMCFSYSGFCLFSSMFGGRSSLRGQCVQPCRRKYGWQRKKGFVKQGRQKEKDGGYLFSMHDLTGIDLLPRLKTAGVTCLKIEGRLKSAEYVRKTVRAYRLLLNEMEGTGITPAGQKEARRFLEEAMGRKSTPGFFLSRNPGEAVTPGLSGNIGLPVGRVDRLQGSAGRERGRNPLLQVNLRREVKVGDRLRLHDERTGERISFTLRHLQKGKRHVKQAKAGARVQIPVPGQGLSMRKGSFRGSLFKVDVGTGQKPEQQIRSALLKAGGPMPEPDQRVIDRMRQKFLDKGEQSAGKDGKNKKGGQLPIRVMVPSLSDCRLRLPFVPDGYIVPLTVRNVEELGTNSLWKKNRLIWSLPSVISEEDISWYCKHIEHLVDLNFTEFQLGHFSQAALFNELVHGKGKIQLSGNYTCNILNSVAAETYLEEFGFSELLFSVETDAVNLEQSVRHLHRPGKPACKYGERVEVGMYVYGYPPLFTARLHDRRYQLGRRFVSPKNELFVLGRENDLTIATAAQPFSLLDKRPELAAKGVDYLVVDLRHGNIKRNIAELTSLFKGHGGGMEVLSGNYAGTLL